MKAGHGDATVYTAAQLDDVNMLYMSSTTLWNDVGGLRQ